MQSNQYKANIFKLCIDQKEDLCISGRLYNPTLKNPLYFEDSGIIFLQMDKILDINGYPQAFQNRRVFIKENGLDNHYHATPEILMPMETYEKVEGAIMTFNIHVTARQFSTWQGSLYDQNNQLIQHFTTVLELMRVILNYLDEN